MYENYFSNQQNELKPRIENYGNNFSALIEKSNSSNKKKQIQKEEIKPQKEFFNKDKFEKYGFFPSEEKTNSLNAITSSVLENQKSEIKKLQEDVVKQSEELKKYSIENRISNRTDTKNLVKRIRDDYENLNETNIELEVLKKKTNFGRIDNITKNKTLI